MNSRNFVETIKTTTVDYRLSTHFFWYAPRLKYALIQKDKKINLGDKVKKTYKYNVVKS